jgi:hypothetical protein
VKKTLSDEGRAWVSDADRGQFAEMIAALRDRFGAEALQAQVLTASLGGEKPDPFARGMISAADLPESAEVPRLWLGVYPGQVTLLVGETGAGKSSLLYNIAIHAARNEPLWGIPFGAGKPLAVLYIDPENAGNWEEGRGGNCSQKIDKINAGRPVDLHFHDGRGVNLSAPAHFASLTATIRALSISVLIADPAIKLFGTRDENDNAEADRQMQLLTTLSRETNCAIIICHHTGKNTDGNYGRGASSRLASADIGIVFRVRGEDEEVDDDVSGADNGELKQRNAICRYQMVKNRLAGRGSLYLQMAGNDKFDLTDFSAWQQAAVAKRGAVKSKSEIARVEIGHALMDGERHSREEILSILQEEKIGRNTADETLQSLLNEGKIVCITGPRNSKFYREAGREVVVSDTNPDDSMEF